MAKFTIIEVQEVKRLRKWVHEVEADTEEEAIDAVSRGDGELVSDGDNIGDEDYGDSGWAAVRDEDEADAEDRALEEFEKLESIPG